MLNDPELVKKINEAADKNTAPQTSMVKNEMVMNDDMNDGIGNNGGGGKAKGLKKNGGQVQLTAGNNSMLSQVVGILIGSPEFQRK